MKTPEYLLSSTRLVLLILTLAVCIFTWSGIVNGEQFMTVMMAVLGYFFGSRGSENKKATTEGLSVDPEIDILSNKLNADDTTTQ